MYKTISEEGIDLTPSNNIMNKNDGIDEVIITDDDVREEIEFRELAIVYYVLGVKPLYRIINCFIRRISGKFGIDRIVMNKNGVFVVKFKTKEGKYKVIDVGLILCDKKPVIMKS